MNGTAKNRKPSYTELTKFAQRHVQRCFNERGTRFADSQEIVDAIVHDPWAWTDLWMDEALAHFSLDKRTRITPHHFKNKLHFSTF